MVGRDDEIEAGVAEASRVIEVRIAGGVAVRTLDAWGLAMRGATRSEDERRPKEALAAAGCATTEDRVAAVDAADLGQIPEDAESLHRWLERAANALGAEPSENGWLASVCRCEGSVHR